MITTKDIAAMKERLLSDLAEGDWLWGEQPGEVKDLITENVSLHAKLAKIRVILSERPGLDLLKANMNTASDWLTRLHDVAG